jgi:putative addiction module component (TIGR02574 family)
MTVEPGLEDITLADEEQSAIDAAWRDTIARRLDDLESGRVQPVNGPEMMARLRAKIAAWQG